MLVKFKLLNDKAKAPTKAHPHDAGFDVYAAQAGTVPPNRGYMDFKTGIAMQAPTGYYGKFASKSGMAINYDVVCFHGTIDNNYRGEMVVRLYNMGSYPYRVNIGDKIAQLVLIPYLTETGIVVDELDETDRGANGFGSTGI